MALTELIPWKRTNMPIRRTNGDMFQNFSREMDRLFNDLIVDVPGRVSLANRNFGSFMPQIEVKETESEFRVAAELPGMEQKDVEVSFMDGVLRIKGEKHQEHEEQNGEWYQSERQYGAFERTIPVPSGVEVDKATAEFRKGVLKIVLPKSSDAQSKRRTIPVEA